ncbi:MAG: hypothetical protein QOF13_891 [Solirubrobacterales bacterium]|nr:hypothetical protein [Solirubrobacterales bacterium]
MVAAMLKVLGDPTRIRLIELLNDRGSATVSALTACAHDLMTDLPGLLGLVWPEQQAIPTDLPEEGFRALFALDLDKYPNHYIYWNPERGEWHANEKEPPRSLAEDSEESD